MPAKKGFHPDAAPSVLLEELAWRTGTSTELIRARLNGSVELDWAGRPVVAAAVARGLVEEITREEAEREQRRAEARVALAEWARKRESFIVERTAEITRELQAAWAHETAADYANAEGMETDLRRATPPPAVRQRVRELLAEDLRGWERKHPRPPAPEEVP